MANKQEEIITPDQKSEMPSEQEKSLTNPAMEQHSLLTYPDPKIGSMKIFADSIKDEQLEVKIFDGQEINAQLKMIEGGENITKDEIKNQSIEEQGKRAEEENKKSKERGEHLLKLRGVFEQRRNEILYVAKQSAEANGIKADHCFMLSGKMQKDLQPILESLGYRITTDPNGRGFNAELGTTMKLAFLFGKEKHPKEEDKTAKQEKLAA
jgi:small nuclear ribonucleoprotein (snRNP)-like protein